MSERERVAPIDRLRMLPTEMEWLPNLRDRVSQEMTWQMHLGGNAHRGYPGGEKAGCNQVLTSLLGIDAIPWCSKASSKGSSKEPAPGRFR